MKRITVLLSLCAANMAWAQDQKKTVKNDSIARSIDEVLIPINPKP
jgi:hypothetical protein